MPRTQKGITPRKPQTKDYRKFFVIAAEGQDTERIYFESLQVWLKTHLQQNLQNPIVKIEFLKREENDKNNSAAGNVIKQLDAYKKFYAVDEQDELWLVLDRDRQNFKIKNLAEIVQQCKQKNYELAITNPCFEFWLLLHLTDFKNYDEQDLLGNEPKTKNSKRFLEAELTKLLGSYGKSSYQAMKLIESIDFAINQAQELDLQGSETWHENRIGTRLHILVGNITKHTKKKVL
jgi:hypothetical protein